LRAAESERDLRARVARSGGDVPEDDAGVLQEAARCYGRFVVLVDEAAQFITHVFCPVARMGRSPCFFLQKTKRGYAVLSVVAAATAAPSRP
jgi:hypothetical protein